MNQNTDEKNEINYEQFEIRDVNPQAQANNESLADKLDESPNEILESGKKVGETFVSDLLESPLGEAADIEQLLNEIDDTHEGLDENALDEFDAIPPECELHTDYTITGDFSQDTDVIVLSIHGGGIEEPTSIISAHLAELYGWSRYDFAGHGTEQCLLGQSNFERLHINSETYNEPLAVEITEKHPKSISIHGFGTENYQNLPEGMILVGGKNTAQIAAFINYIEEHQDIFEPYSLYPVSAEEAGEAFVEIAGQGPFNIVNRNASEAGLQLELTQGLRTELATNELVSRDEDILRLQPNPGGKLTQGNWSKYIDASDIELGDQSSEDIKAIALDRDGNILFSTLGDVTVTDETGNEIVGNGASIFKLGLDVTGAFTVGFVELPRFSESTNGGLIGENVDAMSLATLVEVNSLGAIGGLDNLNYQGDADDLFFSLSSSATLDDFTYRDDDIIAFDGTNFQQYFDGSDVGLARADIDGFDIISNTEILLSFNSAISLILQGQETTVQDADIVKFTATELGSTTSGSFEMYLPGEEVDLTEGGEDIDALQVLDDGSLLVSTLGNSVVDNTHSEQLRTLIYGGIEHAMNLSDETAELNLTLRPSEVISDDSKNAPTETFYFSLEDNTEINGVPYADEDILGFDGTEVKQLFDGSDVGIGGTDLDAFDIVSNREILLSLVTPTTIMINDVSTEVDDSDILKFTATELGHNTTGEWAIFLDGSEVGLDDGSEDIDAVQLLSDGSLLISTIGSTTLVEGVTSRDEDVLRIQPNTANPELGIEWSVYFDGSDAELDETSAEDIKALDLNEEGELNLSTAGETLVTDEVGNDLNADGASSLKYNPEFLGVYTKGNFDGQLTFDSSVLGLEAESIDGMAQESAIAFDDLPPAPQNPAELMLSMRPSNVSEESLNPDNQELIFFSVDVETNLNGVNYRDEDIIAFDGSDYQQYFDSSDVGVSGSDLDGFDIISDTEILLSFSTSMSLNIDGVETAIDDSDIVKFTSTQLGSSTAGEFELFFDGSEFGLTEDNQDIDGLQLLEDGSLLISFLGSTTSLIDGLLVSDEDILRVQPNATETEEAGTWLTYLDGSDLNLNVTNGGDIQGFTLTPLGDLHFSTVGESLVVDNAGNEVSANAADILSYSPTNLGLVTEGIVANSLVFEGDASELTTEKIDAISTENFIDLE